MKSSRIKLPPSLWAQFWLKRSRVTKIGTGLALLVVLTAASFVYGVSMRPAIKMALNDMGLPDEDMAQPLLSGPGNYLGSMFSTSDLETLVFDIKFKHISKLTAERNAALKNDVISSTGNDYVPATIRYLDRNIPVKLRLKGDNTDHLEGDKWSFLIKTRNGSQLLGMRRFSVMNPGVRAAQQEPLAYSYLRNLGLLAPKYKFVNMVVNGTQVGTMALEEYPAKEFLESQGRRESVIVRFNEEQLWADRVVKGYFDDAYNNFAIAPVKVAQEGAIMESEKLTRDLEVATGLLKGFVRGELPASDVFDVAEYGRFLAALEILNARNGVWWANLRFYYNPITARLEPVASDLMSESPWGEPKAGFELHSMNGQLTKQILADPEIRKVFVSELHRLALEVETGSVEEFLKPLERDMLHILRRDRPFQPGFDYDELKRRAAHLMNATVDNLDYFNSLDGEDRVQSTLVLAQTINDTDNWEVELLNAVPAPVEVIGMNWLVTSAEAGAEPGTGTTTEYPIENLDYPIELSPTGIDESPDIVTISLPHEAKLGLSPSVQIIARMKGSETSYPTIGYSSYQSLTQRPISTDTLAATLQRFPFMTRLDDTTLAIKPGQHNVLETITVPKGFDLNIPGGTTLLFSADASVVVEGALTVDGSVDRPVLFDAIPRDGEITGWPGLLVLGDAQTSSLKHATFRNTTGVVKDAWELTGGVNFYQGTVNLAAVTFEDNRAEDALNIIRAEFSLKDVHVNNTVSDGFDSDFSSGTIEGGLFEHIGTAGGGDAIDVSGTTVNVIGTRIQDVSDKGLSVGERSNMTASNVTITRTLAGAASKDASRLSISDSVISEYKIAGLMAYVKKPEYGPSSIESNNVQFSDTGVRALAQTGSKIQIDNESISSETLDIEALYASHMAKAVRL